MSKVKRLKKEIRKIINEEDIFVPFNERDCIEVKISNTFLWCEITYRFIKEEVKEMGIDIEDFIVEFDWYDLPSMHKDEDWYLKKLYYSIAKLSEEILPRLERIKELE